MGEQMINVSDIVLKNGKTWKENNLEKKHNLPLGALVEINYKRDIGGEHQGVRMFIQYISRDCDGTPLYYLSPTRFKPHPKAIADRLYNDYDTIGGFSEGGLKVIKTHEEMPMKEWQKDSWEKVLKNGQENINHGG